MEEMQAIVKRIETNHDDLDAWRRLGELVDDPQKKNDCRDQITRIQNGRCGFNSVIRCEQCGTAMQVIPGEDGCLAMAVCPACPYTKELESAGRPGAEAGHTGIVLTSPPMSTSLLGSQLNLAILVGANLLPAVGVLFMGWSLVSIMALYWIENLIVGFFTILKMAYAKPQDGGGAAKLAMIPFFCVHYGIFCAAHGFFIFIFFLMGSARSGSGNLLAHVPVLLVSELAGLATPVLGLFVSYGFSFYQNYIKSGMYRYASLTSLMSEPYPRIIPLHIGLILGGFVILSLGSPVWIVLILVALKTGAEVLTYRSSMVKWRSQMEGR
jgi:hypothetical protein